MKAREDAEALVAELVTLEAEQIEGKKEPTNSPPMVSSVVVNYVDGSSLTLTVDGSSLTLTPEATDTPSPEANPTIGEGVQVPSPSESDSSTPSASSSAIQTTGTPGADLGTEATS